MLENRFEVLARHTHHDTAEHRDKSSVTVLRKAIVAGFGREPLDCLGREPHVQHGIHHARHRGPRAGSDRDQQRPFRIPKAHPHRTLDTFEGL